MFFPIVGIGASAGGLEAFTRLLKHLPVDTGMGFVLVQHLDPVHESALTYLLGRATSMPVQEVTNNLTVKPNRVYVIPPNTCMEISQGALKLRPRNEETRGAQHSIDSFFDSLAHDRRERAIGVILSGTASDGTLGLEAIKAEGGITFAQDESAKFDSMPRSATAAGCVDFVLSPEGIAKELTRIAQHPSVASASASGDSPTLHPEAEREADQREGPEAPLASGGRGSPRTGAKQARAEAKAGQDHPLSVEQNGFKKILLLLRNHCGVDFSLYKSSTIQRRVTRRMILNRQNTLGDYAAFLKGNAKELDALFSDVLISVTSFFRNPEAFEALKRKVFPALLAQRKREGPVRVWTLGCSTGQEAYSIAMCFAEFSEKIPRAPKLQIYATDLNDALLEKARHGLYAKTLAQDISPERLRRFFVEEVGGYRVSKALRVQVVFARQNVMSDPPFSRMDLISCRNLLIYFEAGLQKKIMPAFHYALKPGGFLFLGVSESVGQFTELFESADKKQKIFSKKAAPTPVFRLPLPHERATHPSPGQRPLSTVERAQILPEGLRGEFDAQREADRLSVSQFAPPGVLINAGLQVLQFRGATSAYLEPPIGKASFDVLKMAREGLMLPLRATINQAKRDKKAVRRENVRVRQNGETRAVNLQVIPLKNLRERCYLILFEEAKSARSGQGTPARDATDDPVKKLRPVATSTRTRRVTELERELSETRDYLQSIQEQYEASNEELQASSEEVQSANEELQSINEELETSKEELESTNEELTTVNEEMQHRNVELKGLNDDLSNLHVSINTAILVLGRDLTIRRFTAQAEKIFNLLAADVGRPMGGIRHNLDCRDLEEFVREVIDTVSVREREVRDREGRWYSLRARPYLTNDNKIDGAVLVLVDIDALKQSEQEIKSARDYAQAILRTTPNPLLVLRADLRVDTANEAFYQAFKVAPADTEGRMIYEIGNRQWNIPKLRELLEDILPKKSVFNGYEVVHEFETLGHRTMLLNARRMDNEDGLPKRILLAIEDITARKQVEATLRESEERYHTLFDLGPIAIYSCAVSGVIMEYNRTATELWGRQPTPGDTDERICGSFKLYRPDGTFMPHELTPMVEVLSGKIHEARDLEVLIERPDGSRVTVLVNIRPLKNERGEITGAINCFVDITERKRAEGRLRESAERLRFMAESMPQKIFTAKLNGDIDYFNQQWMEYTGLTFEQIKDWGWTQLIHPEDVEENIRRWKHSIETCDDFQLEHRFRRKDGVYRWHLSRGRAMRDARGNVLMWIGSNTDIDDAHRTMDEIARIGRAKDDFLAALSHELRTPLTPVLMMAAALRDDERLPPDAREQLGMMERNVALEARLIDDLLDLTKISHGKLLFRPELCDPQPLIDSAIEMVREDARAKRISIERVLTAQPRQLMADPARFQQVVWNLMRNAVKFTPHDGKVSVGTREEKTAKGETWLRIEVADSGIGIDPAKLEQIFLPFDQGGLKGDHRFDGVGLGLAIARAVVDLHAGRISAQSAGLNCGATFVVELPGVIDVTSSSSADSTAADSNRRVVPPAVAPLRLLLVEDHQSTLQTLSGLLQRDGHRISTATSIAEALAAAATDKFDLVISDLGLPDGSGIVLMEELRAKYGLRGIALSGYGAEEDIARTRIAGFVTHLVKPVSIAKLRRVITSFVAS